MTIPGAVSEARVTHGKSSPTCHLPAPLGSFLYVTQERFWHLSFIGSPGYSVPWMSQARTLELLPFPPPGSHPNPGIQPVSLASPALAGGFFSAEPQGSPWPTHKFRIFGWCTHVNGANPAQCCAPSTAVCQP